MGCRASFSATVAYALVLLALNPLLSSPAAAAPHLPRAAQTLRLSSSPSSAPAARLSYKTHYLVQQVDHFGFDVRLTFKQRYLIADQHWKNDNGPILFYTGNEGDITWFCKNTGFMWDVAEELKAMLVFAEHRYYGESLPFGNLSFSDSKHLNYLTSEQALADFAVLIEYLKKTIPGAKNSPVIAIGGSYGGMLAAWFRMKYPHIVIGALAASAPIWQFTDLVSCGKFFEIVTNDFKKSGSNCSETIQGSWKAIDRLTSTGEGLQWISEAFHLCDPLRSQTDIIMLKSWLTETWVNLAMVDYPYSSDFLMPLPAWPIKEVCKYLTDPSASDKILVQNIFQAVNIYYNYSGEASCLNISQTATSNLGIQGWNYQACTEMVMPFCSTGISDMFELQAWDFAAYSDQCFQEWGVRPRPLWIPTVFGGKNISSHSNIIFSNGALDPWYAGGVNENITDTLVSIVIPDGAHHLDLRARNADDPESVLLARTMEVDYMKKWITQFQGHL
ncbi:lysosomal Pro-X carboxypeptidase [Dromiciops gliroides]|uniref:lysosomal Pro-X carboxypeptidase n=1 Tax=Dromiciops gliroides TaxID=33562 RepID=UPI001CC8078C|nr:lysosomal Pro-X carboxypeptidase [Dromiciops gliroides]